MDAPIRIALATRNSGKIAEIRALLDSLPVELVPAADLDGVPEVDEDRPTLRGNARKKADTFHAHTGLPALADDTGLEVQALNHAPGVNTARYAGPNATPAENNRLLLEQLEGEANRAARFRTVVAFVEDGSVHYFEGVCNGRIAKTPRGDKGFGYDPLFIPEGETRTFAEMNPDEKNAISHRKQALRCFADYMHKRLTHYT